jgi:hypothetical protein
VAGSSAGICSICGLNTSYQPSCQHFFQGGGRHEVNDRTGAAFVVYLLRIGKLSMRVGIFGPAVGCTAGRH